MSGGGQKHILVLGVGNILLRDEGIGVHAVEALRARYRFSSNVELLDGGTQGLKLLGPITEAEIDRFRLFIDHLNRVEQVKQYILGLNPEETAISVITRAEILVGIEESSEPLVKAFLDEYHLLNLDKDIADLAASLGRKHGWRRPDAFQAALCLYHNIRFSTRNTKDFNSRKHLFVEIPYIL